MLSTSYTSCTAYWLITYFKIMSSTIVADHNQSPTSLALAMITDESRLFLLSLALQTIKTLHFNKEFQNSELYLPLLMCQHIMQKQSWNGTLWCSIVLTTKILLSFILILGSKFTNNVIWYMKPQIRYFYAKFVNCQASITKTIISMNQIRLL